MAAEFLSTLSLRRATENKVNTICLQCISIHALLAESDLCRPAFAPAAHNFYPRSPCGERRCLYTARAAAWYFYPRSPCGERLTWDSANCDVTVISIHALLAESDPPGRRPGRAGKGFLSTLSLRRATPCRPRRKRPQGISIHALLAESDVASRRAVQVIDISIHALLAESDRCCVCQMPWVWHFYPRSPCGERHYFCGPAL